MIFVKLTGAILICLVGYLIGDLKVKRLIRRKNIFDAMIKMLDEISNNIKYKRENVHTMIANILQNDSFRILEIIPESGNDWPLILENALCKSEQYLKNYTNAEEFAVFKTALLNIGKNNAEKETEFIAYYRAKIKIFLDDACVVAKQNNKIYKMLGLAAGLAVAVIIL